jgi:predicted molibdopterin-dependent oxidoreductase YjgC
VIQADRTVATTCPFCGVGCQIDLRLRQGWIYRVDGRFDSPVNRGNLCVKGRFGFDFIQAPDRLTRPLVRGRRGRPLRPASWQVALDRVADGLRAAAERFGPQSVAVLLSAKCTNEENYLLQKLARGALRTPHVDHCARL